MTIETDNQFIHTRTLLKHVFTSLSKTRNGSIHSTTSSSTGGNTTISSLALSNKSLSMDSSKSLTATTTTSAGESEDGDEDERGNSTDTSSIAESVDGATEDDKMDSVIDLLEDTSIDEEDRPELLKELLSSLLTAPNSEPLILDPLILQLLHRHAEDLNPLSNGVPSLPHISTFTNRPTISRSSSFRRNLTPTMSPVHPPASLSHTNTSSSVSSTSSRSTPSSPFRPSSPPHASSSKGYLWPPSTSNASNSNTPTHSPWSSPRFAALTLLNNNNGNSSNGNGTSMSAQALEFKFSPGASEFRPGSATGTQSPGGSSKGRNSVTSAREAQANWAFTSSPLGTPKYSSAVTPGASGINSASNSRTNSPSYFPRTVNRQLVKKVRLPWAEAGDTEEEEEEEPQQEEQAGEDQGILEGNDYPRVGEEEYGHQSGLDPTVGGWDPFGSTGSNPNANTNPYAQANYYQQPQQQKQHHNGYSTPSYQYNYDGEYQPEEGYVVGEYSEYDNSNPYQLEEDDLEEADGEGGEDGEGGAGFEREIGLGGLGAYSMTPFDVLVSVFAGSEVSPAILEEALVMSGWDIDSAIEYIIETQPGGEGGGGRNSTSTSSELDFSQTSSPIPEELDFKQQQQYTQQQQSNYDPYPLPVPSRTVGASGSRPLIVSRDSFEGYTGGNGGRGNTSDQQSKGMWIPNRPLVSPGGIGSSDPNGRGVGGRVCRYYLSGNCLRSDCKFSHDVGKAVCKFWLRGHCLKGEGGRCDFLHSIPPIMRADYEARARQRTASSMSYLDDQQQQQQEGPDLDFPTLGTTRSHRTMNGSSMIVNNNGNGNMGGGGGGGMVPVNRTPLDPTRSRFALAVKFGNPAGPNTAIARLPQSQPQSQQRQIAPPPTAITRDSLPPPRYSARLHLRPPALLPTLPTGPALSQLYKRYRASFLSLGANRNKCLARAAECWKKGDGKGAKAFSLEAQNWNRQVAIEGRESANRIIEERKRLLKEALVSNRQGSTDDSWDRKVRGTAKAGGIVLGVASTNVLPRGERVLTVEERTEVALDLHGLHSDEAVSFIGDFLQRLEKERFLGLAFIVIGQARHSGGSDPGGAGVAAKRLRLERACSEFLSNQGWCWQSWSGIISVDPLR